MNAPYMAKTAYATSAAAPIRTPRGNEYEAFAKVTHRLRQAANNPQSHYVETVQAVHNNRKLWTLLATDVATEGNALPNTLRAQIFYLAEFTSVHSGKFLRGDADLVPLIDINTAIMRGLRQQGEIT